MTEYNFGPGSMNAQIEMLCRGKVFKVQVCPEMWHPSWWSFLDELATREKFWRVEPGDFVVDVGGDFGSYALSALAQGAAHVVTWSPPFKVRGEAVEAATMVASAAANGWGTDRLTVFTSGLWSRNGFLAAFDGPRMAQWFATPEEAEACIDGQPGHVASFPVGMLDSLRLGKLDLMKIDAEGAELDILMGSEATLLRCQPRGILLENHTHLDPDCEKKCTEFLEALGYRHIETMPHHTISHSYYEPVPVAL
jgi:FkbM family methyltransferase